MREDVKILFEDNHILVVTKPQNLPVQKDESGDEDLLTLLKQYLVEKYNKSGDAYLGLVHRLDRPTGGVMVFAKTSKAASRLCQQVKDGEVEKKYFAIVCGIPKDKQKKLICHLKKDSKTNNVKIVPALTEGAKYAELDYKILDTKQNYSLLAVNLVTGRGHQIRVQMAGMGNPIAGDFRYGEEKIKIPLCLWAVELKFNHPISGERLVFKVYPPEDKPLWNLFNIEQFMRLSVKNNNIYD